MRESFTPFAHNTILTYWSATDKDHNMTLSEGLKAYPKAIGWSILLSAAVVMEGYDTVLIGSFLAFPSFLNSFSNLNDAGTLEISAPWQAALGNGAYIGEILGLQATGWICDRYGNRVTMAIATTLMIGFIFISFFGKSKCDSEDLPYPQQRAAVIENACQQSLQR